MEKFVVLCLLKNRKKICKYKNENNEMNKKRKLPSVVIAVKLTYKIIVLYPFYFNFLFDFVLTYFQKKLSYV